MEQSGARPQTARLEVIVWTLEPKRIVNPSPPFDSCLLTYNVITVTASVEDSQLC